MNNWIEINKFVYGLPFSNRQDRKIIREEGERVSPHSKYWIWNDILWEPSIYNGRPTSRYKPVNSPEKINKILLRASKRSMTTKISKVMGDGFGEAIGNRFEILDL